jgi:hypothetical protein
MAVFSLFWYTSSVVPDAYHGEDGRLTQRYLIQRKEKSHTGRVSSSRTSSIIHSRSLKRLQHQLLRHLTNIKGLPHPALIRTLLPPNMNLILIQHRHLNPPKHGVSKATVGDAQKQRNRNPVFAIK